MSLNNEKMNAAIVDDKSEHCIPFILRLLEAHRLKHENDPNAPPFFVGLNGIQGAGKTVLVRYPSLNS